MSGIKAIKLGLVAVAAIAALVIGGAAFAQGGAAVSISAGAAQTGESGDVTVQASDIGAPGLGAWTIDIIYDTSVVTATDCTPEQGGVCNPNYADGVVRLTGATASGLEGDSTLGTSEFECGDTTGTTYLELELSSFADATLGAPADISDDVTVIDEMFTCSTVTGTPSAGSSFGSDGTSYGWLIALLAVLGMGTVAVAAIRSRAL